MPRVISREERDRAIKEAEAIVRLGKTWQRLEPNERRPNFEAAAAALLRQTLGNVGASLILKKVACSTSTASVKPG